jgi:hypothetical protein
MEEYEPAAATEADRLVLEAEQRAQDGLDHDQTSDNYVLMTVLFAIVLFFVAVGTRFDAVQIRIGLTSLAAVGLITGIVILSTFPIEVSPLADTMPEAFRNGGNRTGLLTVLGSATAVGSSALG